MKTKKKIDNNNVIDNTNLTNYQDDMQKKFYIKCAEFNSVLKTFLISFYESLKCKKDTEATKASRGEYVYIASEDN